MNVILVFLGGGLGAVARYWMQGAVYRIASSSFPYGTLTVNVMGSFFIGLLMLVFDERFLVQPSLRVFLTIGVLGGFTTFSSFSFETFALLREGSIIAGPLNALGVLRHAWERHGSGQRSVNSSRSGGGYET